MSIKDLINKDFSYQRRKTDLLSDYFKKGTITKKLDDVQTTLVPDDKEITLIIGGIRESLKFDNNNMITLGREDKFQTVINLFDLEPFGAVERGVSRMHCQLTLKWGQVFVTDLKSTNGTYLDGKRLEPHQPKVIKKGSKLSLGRLSIRIMAH